MDNMLLHWGDFGRGYHWYYDDYSWFHDMLGQYGSEVGWLLGVFIFLGFIGFLIGLLNIVSYWKLYEKAGLPGWTFLVPVFNMVLMLKVGNRPSWWVLLWFILLFIPVVNIVMSLVVLVYFVRSFVEKSLASTLLTIFFFIFYIPYLAFSADIVYLGDKAELRKSIFE